jgi:hypothetical protein
MSSIATTTCIMPVCDVDEPTRANIASDESTEADSGAEDATSAERAVTGNSSKIGMDGNRGVASPGAGGSSPGAAAWHLIWCHERCHKHDCDEKRAVIVNAAEESQASLLCLKKAAKCAAWLEQAQRPPYALLTDWREVKPCLQAAELHPPRNQPVFTVVLCELPKHYERASAWAQALPARNDPVRICRDIGLLKGLLQELAGQLLAGAALRPRPVMLQRPPGQFNSVAKPFSLYGATQATGYGIAAWTADADDDIDKEFEAVRKQRDSMWLHPVQAVSCLMPAWGATVRSPLVAPSIGGVDQCGYMVQSVTAPHSPLSHVDQADDPQFLKALLMNAMPDHYDD